MFYQVTVTSTSNQMKAITSNYIITTESTKLHKHQNKIALHLTQNFPRDELCF